MALPALTVQRRTWDCLNLVLRYLILEDFRRKIIEVSLSPLLTHQGIMTAPVLNVCVTGTLDSLNRANQTWKWRCVSLKVRVWARGSRLGNALPGCPCEADGEPARGGLCIPGGRGQGWPGLCAPLLPGNRPAAQDTRVLPGEERNREHTSCYQLHKWVTKRERRTLIKSGTSYTINLWQVWDLSKCFQHL